MTVFINFLGFHGIGQWFWKMPPQVRTTNDLQVLKRQQLPIITRFLGGSKTKFDRT